LHYIDSFYRHGEERNQMAWVDKTRNAFRVRVRTTDGKVVTDSVWEDPVEAEARRKEVELEQHRETYIDPRRGTITLAEWVDLWKPSQPAGPAKTATYNSHLRNHILPRFGTVSINKINRLAVKEFVKDLRQGSGGRTPLMGSSTRDVISLLSLILREAIAERRLVHNPCEGIVIPDSRSPERPYLTGVEVLNLAGRARRRADRIMLITAAYTGMRWGEIAGLARHNVLLDNRIIKIDPDFGSLHEVRGKLWLGPPKTNESARNLHLPPFLTNLLASHLTSHAFDGVFVGPRGKYHHRSDFSRRVMRPAADGDPARGVSPVLTGLHFHDLRHTQATWLDEDGIPNRMIDYRLGHLTPGMKGRYRHPTPAMVDMLLDALEARWHASLREVGLTSADDLGLAA
jgi:integrase